LESFAQTLNQHGLVLNRLETEALQVNLGFLCNQACKHCHLEAGPDRTEVMGPETIAQVVDYARRAGFKMADITGGAPELNPHLEELVLGLKEAVPRIMLRANLTALADPARNGLKDFFADQGVVIVASMPALNQGQAEAQRGRGVFKSSIDTLIQLNRLGYGQNGSGLELNLVSNPTGAFLPPEQAQAEKRFREKLKKDWGIEFNNLYTFANVPLGRFQKWLKSSGNYQAYLDKLSQAFNACAVDGLMCRNQVSVDWQGYLYDCDFNLAAGLPLGAGRGRRVHVSQLDAPPEPGSGIAVGDHCYTCTAGAGFT
jgi:radical SAM/Cys-rich protein